MIGDAIGESPNFKNIIKNLKFNLLDRRKFKKTKHLY